MPSHDIGSVRSCRLAAVVVLLCAMAGVQGAPLLAANPAPDAPGSDAPAPVAQAPVCATAATEAMLTALQPSAPSFEQCHASIGGLASGAGELQAGAAAAREALAESRAMAASLNALLATINTPGGLGEILGKIPKFGIFIKTVRLGRTTLPPLALLCFACSRCRCRTTGAAVGKRDAAAAAATMHRPAAAVPTLCFAALCLHNPRRDGLARRDGT